MRNGPDILIGCILTLLLACGVMQAQTSEKRVVPRIRLDEPATRIERTLPLRTGRLSARLYGHIGQEEIVLSRRAGEGGDQERDRAARARLARAIADLAEGKWDEVLKAFPPAGPMDREKVLGTIKLEMNQLSIPPRDYSRELDLVRGILSISYSCGDISVGRDAFASRSDCVIAVRCFCPHAGMMDVRASFVPADEKATYTVHKRGEDILVVRLDADMEGAAWPQYVGVRVLHDGGKTVDSSKRALDVEEANEVVVLISASRPINLVGGAAPTQPGGDMVGPDLVKEMLDRAAKKGYTQLRKDHEAEHEKAFGRVTVPTGPRDDEPMDKRLQAVRKGEKDPSLAPLYEEYARYLLLWDLRPAGPPQTQPPR